MERKYISEIRVELSLPKDSYLKNIPALRYLENGNVLKFDKDITFLVGENGVGKSTIIEAIAVASRINPEGGNENHIFASCNTHSELNEYLDISLKGYPKEKYFLRAETFYNLATYLRNDNGIEKIDYTETEHYKISKMFLDYPERMIKYLFENE